MGSVSSIRLWEYTWKIYMTWFHNTTDKSWKSNRDDDHTYMPISEYRPIRNFLLAYPHSLQHVNWMDQIIKAPKTKHANRTISIPATAMVAFHKWINYQQQALFRLCIQNPEHFILLSRRGEPPQIKNINASFHQIQKRLGFEPKFSTHTLRYTSVSMMLCDRKVSLSYVSRYLGHANTGVTQKYYVGLLPEPEQKEVEGVKDIAVLQG